MKSNNKKLLTTFVEQVDKATNFIEWAKMFHKATTWIIFGMVIAILFTDNIQLIRMALIYTLVLRVIMNILIAIAFVKVRNGLRKVIEKDVAS